MKTFLCIGDVHAPFISKPTFTKLLSFLEALPKKPDYIIQCGDLFDFYAFSRFAKNPNIIRPEQEVLKGRACAEEMWLCLKKRAPKAECYQILGNHCIRPNKKLMELAPELVSLFNIKPLWDFKGVNTIHDPREELVIGDKVFIHGYKTQLGSHARAYMANVICGHSHRGGVALIQTFNKGLIYELNCGYIADPTHEALKYTPTKFSQWTHGFGYIDKFGPRFISL